MKVLKITFLAIVLLGTRQLSAQNGDNHDRVGGIRGGWQMSSFVTDGKLADSTDVLNKFYIGFFRDNRIIPMLFFGSGIEYLQNGMKWTNNSSRTLHVISVPLYLKFKIGPVFALAGAAANFTVSEKLVVGNQKLDPELFGGKTNWFDVPVYAGLGLKILFVTIEARYHWGMINVRDNTKMQYLQVGAGISF